MIYYGIFIWMCVFLQKKKIIIKTRQIEKKYPYQNIITWTGPLPQEIARLKATPQIQSKGLSTSNQIP